MMPGGWIDATPRDEMRQRIRDLEAAVERWIGQTREATERAEKAERELAEARKDTRRMDELQEQTVDTIYLDDGRIIDVRGGNVRAAIDAALAGKAPHV